MIDDDYTSGEGDVMPAAWWRVAEAIPLTVRYRASRIPGLPLLAFADEFYGRSLSVDGPCYLDLSQFTRCNAHQADTTPGGEPSTASPPPSPTCSGPSSAYMDPTRCGSCFG